MGKRIEEIITLENRQQKTLTSLSVAANDLREHQVNANARIGQLAADVLQRDVYQNADNRHQLAIKSAKQGKSQYELTQRHGISVDEAALILSLHSPEYNALELSTVKNANLGKPSELDIV